MESFINKIEIETKIKDFIAFLKSVEYETKTFDENKVRRSRKTS